MWQRNLTAKEHKEHREVPVEVLILKEHEHGLLINFGSYKFQIKKYALSQDIQKNI